MKPDLQRRVQRYGWDKAAGSYEPLWQRQLEPAQDRLVQMVALQPGERVLDVACGTGLVTFPAAAAVGPGGSTLGVDISDGMIETARKMAAAQAGNVSFERMGAEHLDLPDGSFDAVLCAFGLMYVPDPLTAVREMYRVLAPGGRAAAAVWGERRLCGWAEVFPIVDRRVASDVCPLFFQLGTGDVLHQTFVEAGFTDVVSERLAPITLHYDSPEDACEAVFAGGPVALAYDKFDPDMREEAHAEYLASIEPYRTDRGYDIPGAFVLTCGRKPSSTS